MSSLVLSVAAAHRGCRPRFLQKFQPTVCSVAIAHLHDDGNFRASKAHHIYGVNQLSRASAISRSIQYFDDGGFVADLDRRVAFETESQEDRVDQIGAYLEQEIGPSLTKLGFTWHRIENSLHPASPFLVAERHESDNLPTTLIYGHGDVVRGQSDKWTSGAGPWRVSVSDNRIFGRGTVDNKGQHTINIAALESVMAERGGSLGFNAKFLLEMGEEVGSVGLREMAETHRDELKADLLIASDGPRLHPDMPLMFLGSRGVLNFDLRIRVRKSAYHSGNWGGLLKNPATMLVNAIALIADERGKILMDELKAPPMSSAVRDALSKCVFDSDPSADAQICKDWAEPGFTPAERVFGSNTFEVLALHAGSPEKPVNAIPPSAIARCQMRFVAGSNWEEFVPAVRKHLQAHGLGEIEVEQRETPMRATRLQPDHPYVAWAARSVHHTTGKEPTVIPNTGGSLPNDVFADVIGMPTIWVPHGHGSSCQHAPNEHILGSIVREGLQIMTGLFWDLGDAKQQHIFAERPADRV